jgi:hypothetical protein
MTPPHLTRAINRFTAAAIRLQKVREKDALAKAARLDVERFFQAQYGMVMLRFWHMQEYFPQPEPEPVRLMEAKKSPDPAPAALKRWADIWHSIETETTPALQETIVGVERAALPKGADQLRNQLGLEISFRLANPRAVAWFMKHGGSVDYIRGIQQTTAESLNRVITTALDEGWSYTQTAREIQKLYDGPISRQRAQLIATNESAQAYEAGNRAFADTLVDDGVEMEKMWTTSHDDRVSDGCEENESDGWIPIDQPHSSGDQEPPRFPGCRCYEQYRQARA